MFQKNVDSVIKRLTNIAADLEAVIGAEQKANEQRDAEIAKLEVEVKESLHEISRAERIKERIDGFVS